MTKYIIFTDLDGSLLNSGDYDYSAAKHSLARCKENAIPVIAVTSKTLAEVSVFRREAGLQAYPFSVENGACSFVPQSYVPDRPGDAVAVSIDDSAYWKIQHAENTIGEDPTLEPVFARHSDQFVFFSQLPASDVASVTGLSIAQSNHALQRDFTDPIVWRGTKAELDDFRREIEGCGYRVLHGGLFFHILPQGAGKDHATSWLKKLHSPSSQSNSTKFIGIGDAENDLPMLRLCDYPMLVNNNHQTAIKGKNLYAVSTKKGAAGWAELVDAFLDKFASSGPTTSQQQEVR